MTSPDNKKNCYIYTHYTFGIGHLQRASMIAQELAKEESLNVTLFYSGVDYGRDFGNQYSVINLPGEVKTGRKSMKTEADNQGLSREDIINQRIARIIEEFRKKAPDVFITEFFPFAYLRLAETLIPILEYIKKEHPGCKVVCSARDFPISDREDINVYNFVGLENAIRQYYDIVMIHAPQELSMFNEKFPFRRLVDTLPIAFTDHIVAKIANDYKNRECALNRILITVGGGRDGEIIIRDSLDALRILPKFADLRIDIIKGPFGTFVLEEKEDNVNVIESVPYLGSCMNKYALIVSMAGYNTTVEIIQSGVNAILIPRKDSFEQEERALVTSIKYDNVRVIEEGMRIDYISKVFSEVLQCRSEERVQPSKGTQQSVEIIKRIMEE